MRSFKKWTRKAYKQFVQEAKGLLHASRDYRRNRGFDTVNIGFSINDPYYCEVFGMFRTLELLGYGARNLTENSLNNLPLWMRQLETEVLEEEGFFSKTHKCDHCVKSFGKDTAGRTREDLVNA